MDHKISYTSAFEELQNIVAKIEKGQINLEDLSQQVKRATELIRICKSKLTDTEEDVQKMLQETNEKEKRE